MCVIIKENTERSEFMEYILPDYYKQFNCIADKCENTCCAGWGIVIDKNTMKKYMQYEGEFKNRLMNSIEFDDSSFMQYKGRCAFLNDDNLCDIICDTDSSMLCKTCRRYPRHYEEFENIREISLSISCPEACRIILGNKNKMKLESEERELPEETYEDFDFLLFTKLSDIRELLFKVAENRKYGIMQRIGTVLAMSHDLDIRIRKNQLFEVDNLLERYDKDKFVRMACARIKEISGTFNDELSLEKITKKRKIRAKYIKNLHRMETLDYEFKSIVKEYEDIIFELSDEEYVELKKKFIKYYKSGRLEYEQIFVYFIYVYMLGSVYDERLYDKLVFAAVNTMIINEFDFAMWVKNHKLSFEMQVNFVHKYAREIEHSDLNLRYYEGIIKFNKEYKLRNILLGL